jgi:hypothetical protein
MALTKVSFSMISGASVNVKDLGATGDGSTDDSVAINAALAGGNKVVWFPAGQYKINSYCRVYADTKIEMHPDCVILNNNQTSEYVFVNGELGNLNYASGYNGDGNIWITGGTIDNGPRAATSQGTQAIAIGHATNILIENVRFLNNYISHFIEINSSQHVRIRDCYFNNLNATAAPGTREMINIDSASAGGFPPFGAYDNTVCSDVIIDGCVFIDGDVSVGSHSLPAGTEKYHKNITVKNCYIDNMVSAGIDPRFWDGAIIAENNFINSGNRHVRGWGFINSVISNNTFTDGGSTFGITVDDVVGVKPSNSLIIGNRFVDIIGTAIYVSDSFDTQIIANTIINSGSDGIFIDSTAVRGEISSNVIKGAGQLVSAQAIEIRGPSFLVHSNRADNNGNATLYTYGIDVTGSSATDVKVYNNDVETGSIATISVSTAVRPVVDNVYAVHVNNNSVYSVEFPGRYKQGLLLVSTNTSLSTALKGVLWARCDAAPVMESVVQISGATNITLTTGVLTGTTGSVGNITISAADDGKIYLENRTGSSRILDIQFIGH